MTTPQTDAPTLQERLRDGEGRFLKWAYKEQYSGPSVLSIPRQPDNVDALLAEAADALDAREATLAALVAGLESALDRLNASLFENAEHAQAKDVIRAALAKAAALKGSSNAHK